MPTFTGSAFLLSSARDKVVGLNKETAQIRGEMGRMGALKLNILKDD